MRPIALCLVIGVVTCQLGCSSSSEDAIRQWMAEERNQTKPNVAPLSEPKQFIPEPYTNAAVLEPFNVQKLTQAFVKEAGQANTNAELVAPELLRRKEPLEAFPLDAVALVGSLNRAGQLVALVKVDGLLYQLKVGNHLGQNYGLVTKITESEVTLTEIVQDTIGEWVKRVATIQLQENSK